MKTTIGLPWSFVPGAIGVDVERADKMEATVEVVPRRERIAGNLSLDLEAALLGVGVHGIRGHPELHAQREPRTRVNAMNLEILGSNLLFAEDYPWIRLSGRSPRP